jgi:hypothetical protein
MPRETWHEIRCPEHGLLAEVSSPGADAWCRECRAFYTTKGERAKARKRPKKKVNRPA